MTRVNDWVSVERAALALKSASEPEAEPERESTVVAAVQMCSKANKVRYHAGTTTPLPLRDLATGRDARMSPMPRILPHTVTQEP